MSTTPSVMLFCSRANKTEVFTVSIDEFGEYLAQCTSCDHFLKFPSDADLQALVVAHNDDNQHSVMASGDGTIIPDAAQQAQLDSLPPVQAPDAADPAFPADQNPA
jgi:hypothetical protein